MQSDTIFNFTTMFARVFCLLAVFVAGTFLSMPILRLQRTRFVFAAFARNDVSLHQRRTYLRRIHPFPVPLCPPQGGAVHVHRRGGAGGGAVVRRASSVRRISCGQRLKAQPHPRCGEAASVVEEWSPRCGWRQGGHVPQQWSIMLLPCPSRQGQCVGRS